MKLIRIDPNKGLSSLPIFRAVGISFPLLSLTITLIIGFNSNLEIDLSHEGFNYALFSVVKVPLAILAAGVTILGVIAAIHRSSQTTLQIYKATEQNTFSNFYKHRQEYVDHFKELTGELPEHINTCISDKIIRGYYYSTFPENGPTRFTLKPRTEWLETFDEGLIEMSLILGKLNQSSNQCHALLLYTEFLRQETSIRQDLFDINKPENAEVVLPDRKDIKINMWGSGVRNVFYVDNVVQNSFGRLKNYADFICKLKYIVDESEGTMLYGTNSYSALSTWEHHRSLDKDDSPIKLLSDLDSEEICMSKQENEELTEIFNEIRNSYDQKISELNQIKEQNERLI
jgi:hypothetical protein